MKRLRRFLQLLPADRWLLVRAALLLGVVRLALWVIPYPTLCRLLARARRGPEASGTLALVAPEKITWAVETAGRHVPGTTCLTRALAAQVLLEEQGYRVSLHLGVAKGEGGALKAHAWVERDGSVLVGEAERDRYVRLFPSSSGR